MEPFTIQCPTCQSKLRVRDAALLHQIVNCPKCSSMIQVEPPSVGMGDNAKPILFPAPGQADVDSAAVTKEAIQSELGSLGEKIGAVSQANDDAASPAAEGWPDDEFRLAPIDTPHATIPAEAARELEAAESEGWGSDSPPLTPEWTNKQSTQSRQILLISFVGVGGILVASLFFLLFLRWINGDRDVAMAPEALNPAAAEGAIGGLPTESQLETEGENDEPATKDGQSDNGIAVDDPSTSRDATEAEAGVQQQVDAVGENQAVDTASSEPRSFTPGDGVAAPGELSELPPGLLGDGDEAGDSADSAQAAADLPRQLAAFEQLLNYQITPVLPDTEVLPSAPPLTAEEMGLSTDQTGSQPTIDLAELSQVELPPLIIRDRPLSSVINLWNHLSGIPTIANLDALAAAGIDRNQRISLQQVKPLTAQALGRELSAAAGCSLVPRDNAFWSIQPTLEPIRRAVPAQVSLEGLVVATDQAWFLTAMVELLPELDGQMQWQGEQLQFTAAEQQDPQLWFAWFRLVRLVANWQQMVTGKMSLESSNLSELTLRQSLVDPASVAALDKPINFVTMEALPSGQLLSRCADEVGLQCWIDWAHVGAVGLQPSSRTSVVTRNREFRRVLADYASQYSLVVALLDEQNIWLTSPLRYRAEARLYVVPGGGRTAEQWQQQLRLLTPIDANGNSLLRIIPSPDEKWMLLRCCPPALRF